MPLASADLLSLLDRYEQCFPNEQSALREARWLLRHGDNVVDRSTPVHVASGAVVQRPDGRVLALDHRKLNLWLPPGGHVEATDRSFLDAAYRELQEETGLTPHNVTLRFVFARDSDFTPMDTTPTNSGPIDLTSFAATPIDVAIHSIPEAQTPWGLEPLHQHISLLYAFDLIDNPEVTVPADEARGWAWILAEQVPDVGPRLKAKLDYSLPASHGATTID